MSWKNWCRLCGNMKEAEIEIFIKNENLCNLSEAIQQFFSITICDYDEAPKKICEICEKFVNSITNFSLKATKLQEMYSKLEFNDKFEMYTNFDDIREEYGIQNENKFEILKEIEKTYSDMDTDIEDDTPLAQRRNKSHRFQKVFSKEMEIDDDDDTPIAQRFKKSHRFKKVCIKEVEMDKISEKNNIENDYTKKNNIIENNDDKNVENNVECNINSTDILEKNTIKLRKNIKVPIIKKPMSVICKICNRGFVNEGGYKTHLKIAHQISKEPELFPCKTCSKIFKKSSQLKIHENTHLSPDQRKLYPCPHCDKKFTVETSIGGHIRTAHIKEKYFICEECGKAFATSGRLAAHKVVHTDETPYQCTKCSKSFKCSNSLKRHVDSHDDTKYICPICGTQLNTKRILKRHMIIHSDEKKYKCNFCDKDFKRPKDFKNHLILHTGLKPYHCPFCEQTFANGSNCRKHQKTTHPKELAEAEKAGTLHNTRNIPSMQHLKAVNDEAILNNKNCVKSII